MTRKEMMIIWAGIALYGILGVIGMVGCGVQTAKAGGPGYVQLMPSPDGSTCYGFYNGSGDLLGGNCK